MAPTNGSLPLLSRRTVAILGYGNQGHAHALNLRDSGVKVRVGARPGPGADRARGDGFEVFAPQEAVAGADVVVFLLPDHRVGELHGELAQELRSRPRDVGFAHGFAVHFKTVTPVPGCRYFLVGPKGAGKVLRQRFERGEGLPGVFAVGPGATAETETLAREYARAIGADQGVLLKTTFAEETECDLFGEQAVLCGGLMQLMESAFNTLVSRGHSPEMALLECCYEVRTIMELWMAQGPGGMGRSVSPTAYYGGKTRGGRLVTDATRRELEAVFDDIRSGAFAKEWLAEMASGGEALKRWREGDSQTLLAQTFEKLKGRLS